MLETSLRTAGLTSLIVLGVCLAAWSESHARPLFPIAQGIESSVANADLVFHARLARSGDAQQAEGREVHKATIAVVETPETRAGFEY